MEVLQKSSSVLRQSLETQQQPGQHPSDLYKTATFFEPLHPQSQQLLSNKQQTQSQKQLPGSNNNSHNNHQLLHISLPHNSWDAEAKQILSSRVRYQPQEAGLLTPSMIPKASYNSPTSISRTNINYATLPQKNPSFTQASNQLSSLSVRKRPVLAFKLNQPIQPSNEPQEQIAGDAEFWSKVNTILNDADEIPNQNQRSQNHLQQSKPAKQQQNITLPSIISNNSNFNSIGNKANTISQPERAKSKNDSKLLTQQSEIQLSSINTLHCQNSKSPSLNINLSQSSCSTRDSLRQHSSPHHSIEFNTIQNNQQQHQQNQLFHLFPIAAAEAQSSSSSQLNFQRIQPYFSGSQSLKNSGKNAQIPKRISRNNEKPNDENGGNYAANQLNSQVQRILSQGENRNCNSTRRIGLEDNYFPKKSDSTKDMFSSLVATPSIKRISLLQNEENVEMRPQQTKASKVASAPASNTDLCNNYLCTAPDVLQEQWHDNQDQDCQSNKNYHEFSFCNENNAITNNNNNNNNSTSSSSKLFTSSNSNISSASKIISQSAQGYRGQIKKTSLLSRQQDNLVKKLFKIDDKQTANEFIDNNYMQFTGSSQDFRNYHTFKAIYIGSSSGSRIATKNN